MQYQVFLQFGAVCLSILLVEIADCQDEDYYKLLGVKRTSSDKDIKKSFRKLAVKYHPDKNKDPEAEATFVKIAKAYGVLSDPEQRRLFDQLGRRGFENQGNHGNGGGGRKRRGGNFNYNKFFSNFDAHFGNGGFDDDFFNFGFSSHGGVHQNSHHHSAHKKAVKNARGSRGSSHDSFFGKGLFDDVSFSGHQQVFHKTNRKMHARGGRTCRTVTQRVGNAITTYTDCS